MAIKLCVIRNPRTADGGFKDDKNGCHMCGCITTAYIGVTTAAEHDALDEQEQAKICKGCLNDMEYMINRAILSDCIKH